MRNQSLNCSKIAVAAFDWDNTLADNRETIINSINPVLTLFGLPDWKNVRKMTNPELALVDNFPLIFGENAVKAYEIYCNLYQKNYKEYTKLPNNAENVLLWCIKNDIRIVVVTNKTQNLAVTELQFLYPQITFDGIVCHGNDYKNKPNPEHLQIAVKKWVQTITPDKVWMIGDSKADSDCALAAGAQAIRIGCPIWDDNGEKKDDGIAYYDDFGQFYQMLTR